MMMTMIFVNRINLSTWNKLWYLLVTSQNSIAQTYFYCHTLHFKFCISAWTYKLNILLINFCIKTTIFNNKIKKIIVCTLFLNYLLNLILIWGLSLTVLNCENYITVSLGCTQYVCTSHSMTFIWSCTLGITCCPALSGTKKLHWVFPQDVYATRGA
jgi:hypothetical protein